MFNVYFQYFLVWDNLLSGHSPAWRRLCHSKSEQLRCRSTISVSDYSIMIDNFDFCQHSSKQIIKLTQVDPHDQAPLLKLTEINWVQNSGLKSSLSYKFLYLKIMVAKGKLINILIDYIPQNTLTVLQTSFYSF